MNDEEVDAAFIDITSWATVDDLLPEGAIPEFAVRGVLYVDPDSGENEWRIGTEGATSFLTAMGFLDAMKESYKDIAYEWDEETD